MAMIYTIEQLQRVAPVVLSRLREMADLPAYGTVAGQAVASLFFEELGHPVRGPVNDIDVFVNCNMPRTMRGLPELDASKRSDPPRRHIQTAVHYDKLVEEDSPYAWQKFIAMRASTLIMRTYQAGLVNYTLISNPAVAGHALGHGDAISHSIVDGFDMNMVGVGINLETGNVAACDEFIEFLQTSKIKIKTCNTPVHSMIRLASKIESGQITGATCDFLAQRRMLELAIAAHSEASGVLNGHDLPLGFGGGKYLALYRKHAHMLPPIAEKVFKGGGKGEPYTVYGFDVQVSPTPSEQHMLDLIDRITKRQDAEVSRTLLGSRFPALFDLFSHTAAGLSDETLSRRRALEAAAREDADLPSLIKGVLEALGRSYFTRPLDGMDDDGVLVFFFGHEAGMSEQGAIAAQDAWEKLSATERMVFASMNDWGADQLMDRHVNPDRFWDNVLRNEVNAIRVIRILLSTPTEGQGKESQALLMDIASRIEKMGMPGSSTAWDVLHIIDFSKFKYASSIMEEAMTEFVEKMTSLACKRWPEDHSGFPPESRAKLLALRALLGGGLSEGDWSDMDVDARIRFLDRLAVQWGTGLIQGKPAMRMIQLVEDMTRSMDVDQLLSSNGKLIHLMLRLGMASTLDKLLVDQVGDHPVLDAFLSDARSTYAKSSFGLVAGEWHRYHLHVHQNDEDGSAPAERAMIEALIVKRKSHRQGPVPPSRPRSRI